MCYTNTTHNFRVLIVSTHIWILLYVLTIIVKLRMQIWEMCIYITVQTVGKWRIFFWNFVRSVEAWDSRNLQQFNSSFKFFEFSSLLLPTHTLLTQLFKIFIYKCTHPWFQIYFSTTKEWKMVWLLLNIQNFCFQIYPTPSKLFKCGLYI